MLDKQGYSRACTRTQKKYVIVIAFPRRQWFRERAAMLRYMYKMVQIWPGQTVTCLHTNSPGNIWTTLYIACLVCEGLRTSHCSRTAGKWCTQAHMTQLQKLFHYDEGESNGDVNSGGKTKSLLCSENLSAPVRSMYCAGVTPTGQTACTAVLCLTCLHAVLLPRSATHGFWYQCNA
jgi:hypothetical protein